VGVLLATLCISFEFSTGDDPQQKNYSSSSQAELFLLHDRLHLQLKLLMCLI
jgi:hypothetical protein